MTLAGTRLKGQLERPSCPPGIKVEIPANALQDAQGNPSAGMVQVELATIDLNTPEQMPGDYTVLDNLGC